jgi:AcrR family transcriptional regulator/DNA-binding MarR family transcriptional regulator
MSMRNTSSGARGRPRRADIRSGGEIAPADAASVALERLRPGRDSHSRDKVDGIQRARIVSAMAEVVTEQGLPAATVANVVARAGVSRRTFYELFADREECFLAAFDHATGLAAAAVLSEYERPGPWRDQIRAGLLGLLEFLDEEPSLGALCVVHSLGAGPTALERRGRIVDGLIAAVDEGGQTTGGRRNQTTAPLTAEGVVGAVLAVIHARLVQPTGRPMVELLGPLMNMIVLPYQGAAAANRELARPAPKGRAKPRRPAGDPLKDLDMRLTYRTVRVLIAIATDPGTSNREVGAAAGIADQGQISKLLQRLTSLGLIENNGAGHSKGEANAWQLTAKGLEVERTIRAEATPSDAG